MNNHPEKQSIKDSLNQRREKEATALRENLKRRKKQQQAKQEQKTS